MNMTITMFEASMKDPSKEEFLLGQNRSEKILLLIELKSIVSNTEPVIFSSMQYFLFELDIYVFTLQVN